MAQDPRKDNDTWRGIVDSSENDNLSFDSSLEETQPFVTSHGHVLFQEEELSPQTIDGQKSSKTKPTIPKKSSRNTSASEEKIENEEIETHLTSVPCPKNRRIFVVRISKKVRGQKTYCQVLTQIKKRLHHGLQNILSIERNRLGDLINKYEEMFGKIECSERLRKFVSEIHTLLHDVRIDLAVLHSEESCQAMLDRYRALVKDICKCHPTCHRPFGKLYLKSHRFHQVRPIHAWHCRYDKGREWQARYNTVYHYCAQFDAYNSSDDVPTMESCVDLILLCNEGYNLRDKVRKFFVRFLPLIFRDEYLREDLPNEEEMHKDLPNIQNRLSLPHIYNELKRIMTQVYDIKDPRILSFAHVYFHGRFNQTIIKKRVQICTTDDTIGVWTEEQFCDYKVAFFEAFAFFIELKKHFYHETAFVDWIWDPRN